eukprot:TRINITY_DN80440_c0_g1_i1.p4 TRINITY_DN80440_c0_g1~~TRINITY_DN80440_c0_g1_i1.p4  ORF type:complete len:354 (-),score=146.65 TRINITY_DN80440_c0_g1_i1:4846-5907(-)
MKKVRQSEINVIQPVLSGPMSGRVRRLTDRTSDYVLHLANVPSLGEYRVQEHIRRTVPELLRTRTKLNDMAQGIEDHTYDVEYALDALKSMQRIKSFSSMRGKLEKCLQGFESFVARPGSLFGDTVDTNVVLLSGDPPHEEVVQKDSEESEPMGGEEVGNAAKSDKGALSIGDGSSYPEETVAVEENGLREGEADEFKQGGIVIEEEHEEKEGEVIETAGDDKEEESKGSIGMEGAVIVVEGVEDGRQQSEGVSDSRHEEILDDVEEAQEEEIPTLSFTREEEDEDNDEDEEEDHNDEDEEDDEEDEEEDEEDEDEDNANEDEDDQEEGVGDEDDALKNLVDELNADLLGDLE